jgi:hypothetical protein
VHGASCYLVLIHFCILTTLCSIPDIYLAYQNDLRDRTDEVPFNKFLHFLLAKLLRTSNFDKINKTLKKLVKIAVEISNTDQSIAVDAQDTDAFCKGQGILMINELQELLLE